MCRHLLLVIALVVAGAAPVAANGRYPASSTIHFRPGSTSELYVGATWGLLYTQDGGATWRWVCEQAVGYGGEYDPDYAVSPAGTLLATTFDGLRTTRDGCVWTATPLGASLVSSVTVASDGAVWVAAADAGDSKIYKSSDDGVRFAPTATTGTDAGAWWESLEVAPSNAQRAYLAGYRIENGEMKHLLLRTDNGGGRWISLATTGFAVASRSTLQIAAISPDDPDLLIARITVRPGSSIGDALYRSTDAGVSWQLVLESEDDVPGVAIRAVAVGQDPDDAATVAEVVAGTRKSGIFRSTNGGATFAATPRSLEVGCLAERAEDRTLFACANNLTPDNMALARSTDALAWTPALEFRNVTAPAACGDDTVQHQVCQEQFWCGFKNQLSIISDVIECPAAPPDAGTGPIDAGTGPSDKDGCGCAAGGSGGGGLVGPLLTLVWGWRRWRVSRASQLASKALY